MLTLKNEGAEKVKFSIMEEEAKSSLKHMMKLARNLEEHILKTDDP